MRGGVAVGSGPKVPRRGDLRACSSTAVSSRLSAVAHPRRARMTASTDDWGFRQRLSIRHIPGPAPSGPGNLPAGERLPSTP